MKNECTDENLLYISSIQKSVQRRQSLPSTVCFFMVWLLFLLNRETGGSIFSNSGSGDSGWLHHENYWNVLDSLVQLSPFHLLGIAHEIFLTDYAPHLLPREAGKCRSIVFPTKKRFFGTQLSHNAVSKQLFILSTVVLKQIIASIHSFHTIS